MKQLCPCCGGSGTVSFEPRSKMPKTEDAIYGTLLAAPDGLMISDLVDRVYGCRRSGGPLWPKKSIHVLVGRINKRIAPLGKKIVSSKGHYSVYRVISIQETQALVIEERAHESV